MRWGTGYKTLPKATPTHAQAYEQAHQKGAPLCRAWHRDNRNAHKGAEKMLKVEGKGRKIFGTTSKICLGLEGTPECMRHNSNATHGPKLL